MSGVKHSTLRTPTTSELHYATELSLVPRFGINLDQVFAECLNLMCQWSAYKVPVARSWLMSSEFKTGGQWRNLADPSNCLRTEFFAGSESAPDAWGMFYQHREADGLFRRFWHIDVTLKKHALHYALFVSISHSLDPGFVGWEPALPEPSAPRFVSKIIDGKSFSTKAGRFGVGVSAMSILPNEAASLKKIIFDDSRYFPVVLIFGDPNPVTFPVYPQEVNRRLLGTCYTIWAQPVAGWPAMWSQYFPRGYWPPENSVRIYQPNADEGRKGDDKRHRFFLEDEIHERGSENFVRMLQHSLVRRFCLHRIGRLKSCDDVLALKADAEFEKNRLLIKGKEAEADFYAAEHDRVHNQYKLHEGLLQEAERERDQAILERDSLKAYSESLQSDLEEAKTRSLAAKLPNEQHEAIKRLFAKKLFPADLLYLLPLIAPGAVVVLPSAIKSAEESEGFQFVDELRDLLLKLVFEHRDRLIKGSSGGNEVFVAIGKNKFSAHEAGSLSEKGRAARTFSYRGNKICMEQHLKIGMKDSTAETLRVHFHWDSEKEQVIIGHCGKHLPL